MIKKILLSSALLGFSYSSAYAIDLAPDGITVGYGKSINFNNKKADLSAWRASLVWDWNEPLITFSSLQLGGYFDLAFNYWKSNLSSSDLRSKEGASKVKAVSFSPVFRLESAQNDSAGLFFDAGVGLSYQSDKDVQQEKANSAINMGGNTQFEIRTMIGIAFGERKQYEIAYGWYHYSNAHIHSMNEGLDYQLVHIGWRF